MNHLPSTIHELIVFIDDDGETEDLLEQIALGRHREALDRRIGQTGQTDVQFAVVADNFQFGDALGVRAFQSVGHAQDRRQFANADAVVGAERGIAGMIKSGTRMAVITCDQGNDRDIEAVKPDTSEFKMRYSECLWCARGLT